MRNFLIVCFCLLCLSISAWAQTVEVTGTVIDENKEPMIGVSVSIPDTPGLGVATDIYGKYRIKIEPYHKLAFSFIGYKTKEVLIKDQRVVNIQMEINKENVIDEVVVTGLGSQKKLTLTGAVTSVDVETLKSTPTGILSNSLAGNVAGVLAMQTSGQPGYNKSEFWVRGISTFGASTAALVLVDGFERDLNDVNVEDVASFTVLKDASATAIYGARGANGVVLITTKHGKAGKVNISAKVETTYNTRTITPKFADGYTYASMMNESRITRNAEPVYQPEELEIFRLGLDPDLYPNVDWQDILLKKGAMNYRALINMSGGGNTARYYVSLAYTSQDGMYKTDDAVRKDYNTNANSEKWDYRLNTDIDVTKTTLVKVGVGGIFEKWNKPGIDDIWHTLVHTSPIAIPYMYSNGYIPAYGTGNRTNPWVMATQTGYQHQWRNKVQTNITLEQNFDFITKGLRFVGRFGFDTFNDNWIAHKKWPEQWKAQKSRNELGQLVFDRVSTESKMFQESGGSGNRQEVFEAELHYDRRFAKHQIGGILKYTQDSWISTQNLGGDILNSIAKRHIGLAGRVSYNWNYRYFIDFNFGRNGSENFADGHHFGFFPAVSGAWNIAEEKFVQKNLKWMNMFKIRYSFGKVGNDDVGRRFPYVYSIGDYGGGYEWGDYNAGRSYGGMSYTSLATDDITWEVATKHDLGIDLVLFDNRFSVTADYFHEQRDGIFMERGALPAIVGVNQRPVANVGSVLSTGTDGNFSYSDKIGKVHFTIRGNWTLSKNEILERDEMRAVYAYQMDKGHRVNQARGLIAEGLFKDYDDIRNSPRQDFGTVQPGDIKYKDVNGDGVVNDGDRVAIGATTRPNAIYGVGASFNWNGFDFNIHFQGAGKSSFFINGPTVYAFSEGTWGNVLKQVAESNRWIDHTISGTMDTEDPNADYPRLSYGGNGNNFRESTFWLRDGRYCRLKTLEIGYSLPREWMNKIRFNNMRFFFMGTNLLTFSKFKLWDPEMGSSTGTNYPLVKSVTVGVTINL